MKIIEFEDIVKEKLKSVFGNLEEEKSLGLCQEAFKNIYNPSGGHGKVYEYIKFPKKEKKQIFLVEHAYRHFDRNKICTGYHSSFFKMLTLIKYYPIEEKKYIETLRKEFLHKVFSFLESLNRNLYTKDIKLSYFAGNITGIYKDNLDFLDYKKVKKVAFKGNSMFYYSPNHTDVAGYRNEIYVDDKELVINLYAPYLSLNGNIVENNKFFLLIMGTSLERLLSFYENNFSSIWKTSHFQVLQSLVINRLKLNKDTVVILQEEIRTIIDRLRAIIFIVNDCDVYQIKGRNRQGMFEKLLEELIRSIEVISDCKPMKIIYELMPQIAVEEGINENKLVEKFELYKRSFGK